MTTKEAKSIRQQYVENGVAGYYSAHGASYRNPHFDQLRALVTQNQPRLDYNSVLDFCCGSGEISLIVKELGYKTALATDPFTAVIYQENTHQAALPYSFEDVIKGKLEGQFSCIICSFAMHLCPAGQLFSLAWELFAHTTQLVILTPHKRPELENFSPFQLDFEDFVLTPRGKKVRLKCYSLR